MNELKTLLQRIEKYIIDPTQGLPEEIYLFATEITPMVNVDLLIKNNVGEILLAWREDECYGTGWHVPGGVLRLKESFQNRIQKTAQKEIGCSVISASEPLEIVPIVTPDLKTRGHYITFVYECKLPQDFQINNRYVKKGEEGYLAWHSKFPGDMVKIHSFYKKYFKDS